METPEKTTENREEKDKVRISADSQADASDIPAPEEEDSKYQEIVNLIKRIENKGTLNLGKDIYHLVINLTGFSNEDDLSGDTGRRVRRQSTPKPSPRQPGESIQDWFEKKLQDRERYCAIALSMFSGIRFSYFREIYSQIFDALGEKEDAANSAKGGNRPSLFTCSLDSYIETVGGEVVRSLEDSEDVVQFHDESDARKILDLMRLRYRDILFHFLPVLSEIIQHYQSPQVRGAAADALVEIAQVNFQVVITQVLFRWAQDSRAYVRASVGYPLKKLACMVTYRPHVKKLLQDWYEPVQNDGATSWRLPWTAASVLKQIGDIKEPWADDWVYSGLRKLAASEQSRVIDSVIHTLIALSFNDHLSKILSELQTWLSEGADKKLGTDQARRADLATVAFIALSIVHNAARHNELEGQDQRQIKENLFDCINNSQQERNVLQNFLVTMGMRVFQQKDGDIFFALYVEWITTNSGDKVLQEFLSGTLFEIFCNLHEQGPKSARQCEHIWNHLSKFWTKDDLALVAISVKTKIKTKFS